MAKYLIQILLPLRDNDKNRFPSSRFSSVKNKLTDFFGGLTAFTRSPALGRWEVAPDEVVQDEIAVFEVMANELNRKWWGEYRKQLETLFQQERIIIRVHEIEIL